MKELLFKIMSSVPGIECERYDSEKQTLICYDRKLKDTIQIHIKETEPKTYIVGFNYRSYNLEKRYELRGSSICIWVKSGLEREMELHPKFRLHMLTSDTVVKLHKQVISNIEKEIYSNGYQKWLSAISWKDVQYVMLMLVPMHLFLDNKNFVEDVFKKTLLLIVSMLSPIAFSIGFLIFITNMLEEARNTIWLKKYIVT